MKMVESPYGNDNLGEDPRKMKLQVQAQQQYISQLQQRIAAQSNKIEELMAQIQQLQNIIAEKDAEIEQYSQRLQEQRYYAEEEKKIRNEKEHILQKQLNEKEREIRQLKQLLANVQEAPSVQSSSIDSELHKYIEKMITHYKRPTTEDFVQALRGLLQYCTKNGTLEQRVLGVLLNSKVPLTIEEIAQRLNEHEAKIKQAIVHLVQEENVKKIGRGYTFMSSELVQAAPDEIDWSSASPEEIFNNLSALIYVGAEQDEIINAFTSARDRLMEIGALSPLTRHAMSQQIEKMKRYPINVEELQALLEKWKNEIKRS